MKNALVEAGLVLASLLVGLLDLHVGFIGWSVSSAMGWWLLVHETRLAGLWQTAKAKAIGSLGLAFAMIGLVHLISFGLGYMFHAILAPS
jgi:hypothetical protein